MRKNIAISVFAVGLLVFWAVFLTPLRTPLFGPKKYAGPALPPSTLAVPTTRTIAWRGDSELARDIYASWARRSLSEVRKTGKSDGTRIILGHLLARKQMSETNALIQSLSPWGTAGTSGWQNPRGDYDFEEAVYTTILWTFAKEPDVLTPAARDHILNVMLTEEGNGFRTYAPRTLGLFEETENHMLMTEGSRYLKNRWLAQHGDSLVSHDNVANGMEANLLSLISTMRNSGFPEFNSQPYIGYTLLGLLNLEAFASDPVRSAARDLLDYMNWCYALGAYQLRHFAPFRRRYEYAGMTSLTAGYQTAYMNAWLSFAPSPLNLPALSREGLTHSLIAAVLPYRPSDAVVKTLFDKGSGYFVKLGHGEQASPEIFSAGPHFLLSAGGVNRGERTILVALPIVLLCDSQGDTLDSVFHMAGPGKNFKEWNDTGVYKRFACAAGPVHVPSTAHPLASNDAWAIYSASPGILVAVHSTPDEGIMVLFQATDPSALLRSVAAANPDPLALRHSFTFPGANTLTYDLDSPKDKWVMISDGSTMLDRSFDRWPLLSGEFDH